MLSSILEMNLDIKYQKYKPQLPEIFVLEASQDNTFVNNTGLEFLLDKTWYMTAWKSLHNFDKSVFRISRDKGKMTWDEKLQGSTGVLCASKCDGFGKGYLNVPSFADEVASFVTVKSFETSKSFSSLRCAKTVDQILPGHAL